MDLRCLRTACLSLTGREMGGKRSRLQGGCRPSVFVGESAIQCLSRHTGSSPLREMDPPCTPCTPCHTMPPAVRARPEAYRYRLALPTAVQHARPVSAPSANPSAPVSERTRLPSPIGYHVLASSPGSLSACPLCWLRPSEPLSSPKKPPPIYYNWGYSHPPVKCKIHTHGIQLARLTGWAGRRRRLCFTQAV
jgi:hypothetical protein